MKKVCICKNCKGEFVNNSHSSSEIRVYCSNKCQAIFQRESRISLWLLGEDVIIGKNVIKGYLQNLRGNTCDCCGNIAVWQNKPLVLEMEHIDGNSNNNKLDNLKLLCPNCHSQTPTFKGRNKGNGRYSRRIRYQEGKSY